ncbi:heme-degrading domain-containing protein [Treponema sp.]
MVFLLYTIATMTANKELLDRIAAEEAELVLDHFTEDDAWKLGLLLVEAARKNGGPIALDIRRPGQILFHAAMPGAVGDNDEWIRRKTNVLFRFRKSSFAVGVNLGLIGQTVEEKYNISSAEYATHGGAFPICVKGAGLVAALTVSGLAQEDDHAMAVECLRRLKAKS